MLRGAVLSFFFFLSRERKKDQKGRRGTSSLFFVSPQIFSLELTLSKGRSKKERLVHCERSCRFRLNYHTRFSSPPPRGRRSLFSILFSVSSEEVEL